MTVGVLLLWALGFSAGSATAEVDRYPNPICWKEPRIYHPGGAQAVELQTMARGALHISRRTAVLPHPRTSSPNGAYAFHYSEIPRLGPPSGSTRVALLVFKERRYLLSVEAGTVWGLRDIRWVNEKLICFRLWLGRLRGVDVVLDVEAESLARLEAFEDGRLLWEQARESCKALPRSPGCHGTCETLE